MEITPEEKEKAILYLIKKIPEDTFKQIWAKIQKEGNSSLMEYHHGFGTEVRNILRQGGFRWGAIALDQEWDSLILEAAKRKYIK